MSCSIAILGTRGIPNHYGGFEQLAEYLAPALVAAGYDVTVYSSHNHVYKEEEWKGVRIRHCYDPEHLMGSAGQFVYDLNCVLDARKRSFDVILQLGYTSSSVWGSLFPPGAVIIYNMDGMEWQRAKYPALVQRFLRYAEKLAVRYSHRTIADNPVIQSYLREKYGIRSEYIAYGAEIFEDPGIEGLAAYGVTADEYYLLIARMEPDNNIEKILDGVAAGRSDRKILVVGELRNKYAKRLQRKFKNDPRIVFSGGIYDQKKLHLLKFYSRLYFHGHSTGGTNPSLLEAMASGAFIVAHDNPFNRNVLGGNAMYFTQVSDITGVVDAIPSMTEKSVFAQRNKEKIRAEFSWADIVSGYERFILQSLLQTNYEKHILYRRYPG